jgi:hypothetical protein
VKFSTLLSLVVLGHLLLVEAETALAVVEPVALEPEQDWL